MGSQVGGIQSRAGPELEVTNPTWGILDHPRWGKLNSQVGKLKPQVGKLKSQMGVLGSQVGPGLEN